MFVPFVGVVQQHLKSWSLGPVLQCLDRFLEEPAFRRTLIRKPKAFTRPQGLSSLPVTLKTFFTQCLAQDHSCRTAVATAKAHGWLPPSASPDTAAYCRARDALAADGLQEAVEHTAQALDTGVSEEHLWLGRQVQVVDGTGSALPDTEANQDAYPQPSPQQPGCGFPVLRLVAFMSLATGAVSRYRLGNLHAHEPRLFQELRAHLAGGEVASQDQPSCWVTAISAPLPISSCSSSNVPMASFVVIRRAGLGCTPSSVWAEMITSYAGSKSDRLESPYGSMPR